MCAQLLATACMRFIFDISIVVALFGIDPSTARQMARLRCMRGCTSAAACIATSSYTIVMHVDLLKLTLTLLWAIVDNILMRLFWTHTATHACMPYLCECPRHACAHRITTHYMYIHMCAVSSWFAPNKWLYLSFSMLLHACVLLDMNRIPCSSAFRPLALIIISHASKISAH